VRRGEKRQEKERGDKEEGMGMGKRREEIKETRE
jgi:hypothetical protein